jgi:hypothetical protein
MMGETEVWATSDSDGDFVALECHGPNEWDLVITDSIYSTPRVHLNKKVLHSLYKALCIELDLMEDDITNV